MNLTIDIGNSRTKYALFNDDDVVVVKSFEKLTAALLENIFSEYEIENAILSSVADYDSTAQNFLQKKTRFIEFTPKTSLPLKNKYHTPETLGKDRLAAAAAAVALFPKTTTLVIDAGTCITYELVTAAGEYIGGGISPGIKLRLKALNAFTGRLPLVEPEIINFLEGTSTKNSILSGVMNGVRMEIDGMITAYHERNTELKVLLTGGDMAFFESTLKNKIFAVPNLVLIGLNKILNHNVANR